MAGERAGPLGILFVFIRRRECARYFYILWLSLFENCTRGYISLAVVCPQPSSLYMCRNAHVYNYKYMSRSVSSLNIYVSRGMHICVHAHVNMIHVHVSCMHVCAHAHASCACAQCTRTHTLESDKVNISKYKVLTVYTIYYYLYYICAVLSDERDQKYAL